MDHLTQEEDPFPRIFFYGFKGDLDGVFHAITKSKMPGQEELQCTQIDAGWRKIFLELIICFSLLFDSRDQGTPVGSGDVE
jgi:hypothetical protein